MHPAALPTGKELPISTGELVDGLVGIPGKRKISWLYQEMNHDSLIV